MDVSGFENGWFHVSYNGSTGFMSGDYLTLTDSKPTPVTTTTSGSSSSSSSSKGSSSSSSSSKGSTSLPSGGSAGRGSGTGADLVAEGERYLGVRYVYGGASPSGFDCSGFTMYVYAQFGYSLPHGANRQLSDGTPISKGDLQPGDLVFFGSGGEITHVGIYIGGGKYIAADGSAYGVRIGTVAGSGFTHWFRLKDIAYERKEDEMVTKETIFYNDKAYTVSLIRKDGVTYLKTRDIAEILGLAVGSRGKAPVLADKPTA